MTASSQIVIPAQAGTHSSAAPAFELWVPAFAGMTAEELLICHCERSEAVSGKVRTPIEIAASAAPPRNDALFV
jgi:hypothetical protein